MQAKGIKCRKCWADKAYWNPGESWQEQILSYLFVVPVKCHHCYHQFRVSWFHTFGKQVIAPAALPEMNGAAAVPQPDAGPRHKAA